MLACEVADSTGDLTALFYGRAYIAGMEPGRRIRLHGMVGIGDGGRAADHDQPELWNRRDITRRVFARKAQPPPVTPVTGSGIVGQNTPYTGGKGPR